MSIYKTPEGRLQSLELYDKQLKKLDTPCSDIYIDTSYGKTHLVLTGNPAGIPLLVFHGGNCTSAYNLIMCSFLLRDFRVYAVDTIGHPGKSEERSLPHRGYSYGKWASEVIDGIGYDKIACFGGSFCENDDSSDTIPRFKEGKISCKNGAVYGAAGRGSG